ncbi:MAG: alanine racemase [Pedosphaera sp.]|nr:alanine racemase [Pedosphaera sp.]MSU43010.1 alanine racemase [Pedosphaera sp.]
MSFTHRCWAEIDLDALRGNLAWLRYRIGPQKKILTVVKADAYGHGLRQVAALLMQAGTDIFGVANLQEARDIRSVGRGFPILMLGACLPDEVETAVKDNVMPTLSTIAEARAFSATAARLGKSVQAHLKVDTGMGRLGAPVDAVPKLLAAVDRLPHLRVTGLYTHYAAAEDDAAYSRRQRRAFEKLVQQLARDGRGFDFIHANNSAALLHEPDAMCNLARPGLLVYGVLPPGRRRAPALLKRHLRPALSLKCRVALVKTIEPGASLSYGRSFVASRRMRVATLTAGYGDGYLRSGSGSARVLVGGRLCSVLGRITMDQLMVDVSRVRAQPGDEAVLIGKQGRAEITAQQLAQWCGTVPWEILTAITYRVPRLYCGGSAA